MVASRVPKLERCRNPPSSDKRGIARIGEDIKHSTELAVRLTSLFNTNPSFLKVSHFSPKVFVNKLSTAGISAKYIFNRVKTFKIAMPQKTESAKIRSGFC